jgi:ketosteroid isomerase-like protein
MSEQDNRAVVQRGYEAFGRGDIPGLLSLLDDQIEWVTPGPPELPTAGARRGHSQVAEFFQTLVSLFEVQRFEPRAFVAEADRVLVLGSETAKVKTTGKVIEVEWAHAFTLREGKVVAFQEYFDTAAVVAELRAAQAHT